MSTVEQLIAWQDHVERQRQWLLSRWSTPAQREYNRTTQTCQDCNGRGYHRWYQGKVLHVENVGCQTCQGTGKVPL